jgi:hypothetical protein
LKHFVKYSITVILMCVVLVGMTITQTQKTLAATAATLDTVFQYKLVNVKSGLVLGISSPQLTAGSAAIQEHDTNAGDQHWHFIPAGNGDYKILNYE